MAVTAGLGGRGGNEEQSNGNQIAFGELIMEEIERGHHTPFEIATALGRSEESVRLVLSELVGTGWVVESGDQYMLVEQPAEERGK